MKKILFPCFIIILNFSITFAQKIEKDKITNEKNITQKMNSTQTVEGDVTFKDDAYNILMRITDEGTYGTIQLSDGIPSTITNKLYNSGGTLYFNGSSLGSGPNSVDSLNDLIDAKYDGESLFIGEGSGSNDDAGASDGAKNFNLGIGKNSLFTNTTGIKNAALGTESLFSNLTGNRNTSVGSATLFSNISGSANTVLGFQANYFNETGERNTIIGSRAGYGSIGSSFSDNIFIGYHAGYNETESNKLYIENSESDTPLIWGDFLADQVKINGKFEVTEKIVTSQLKVTDGVTEGYILTSDTEGNATWQAPQKIGFAAYLQYSLQENLYAQGDNQLNYFVEDYDEGNVFNPTAGEFTAPSDGFYHFDINITWLDLPTDCKGTVKVKKNGQIFNGSIYESYVNPEFDSYSTFSFSLNTQLQINDVITIWFDGYDPITPTGGVVPLSLYTIAGGNTDYTSAISGFKIN